MNSLNKNLPSPLKHVKVALFDEWFPNEYMQKMKDSDLLCAKIENLPIHIAGVLSAHSMLRMMKVSMSVDHVCGMKGDPLRNAESLSQIASKGDQVREKLIPIRFVNQYAADNKMLSTAGFNESSVAGFVRINEIHGENSSEVGIRKIAANYLRTPRKRQGKLLGQDSDL